MIVDPVTATSVGLSFSALIHAAELLSLKPAQRDLVFASHRYGNFGKRSPMIKLLLITIVFISVLSILTIIVLGIETGSLLILLLSILNLLVYSSRSIGRDGADQLRTISLLILGMSSALPNGIARDVAAIFISVQVLTAYMTSGIAKMGSPVWQRGDVLVQILNNYTYGTKSVADLLSRRPALNRVLSILPIVMMSATPLAFLLPWPHVFFVLLVGMLGFHIMTGLLMGLNDFVLTFPATFPCLIYSYFLLHGWFVEIL